VAFHAIQNRKHADPDEWRFALQLNLTAHGPQQDRGKYDRRLPSIVRPTAYVGDRPASPNNGLCLFSVLNDP
jgi:hypothetical protein